jgi:hypothetical protein
LDIVPPGVYYAEASGSWLDDAFRVERVTGGFRPLNQMLQGTLIKANRKDQPRIRNAVIRVKVNIYPNGTITNFNGVRYGEDNIEVFYVQTPSYHGIPPA